MVARCDHLPRLEIGFLLKPRLFFTGTFDTEKDQNYLEKWEPKYGASFLGRSLEAQDDEFFGLTFSQKYNESKTQLILNEKEH